RTASSTWTPRCPIFASTIGYGGPPAARSWTRIEKLSRDDRRSGVSFVMTEEQEALQDVARRFFEDKSPEATVRQLMETEQGYDTALWRTMARQVGLQGIFIPEALGGAGSTHREFGLVMEEVGRSLVCAPFFSTIALAANALLESGDERAQQEW